jgi:hypothetical protein
MSRRSLIETLCQLFPPCIVHTHIIPYLYSICTKCNNPRPCGGAYKECSNLYVGDIVFVTSAWSKLAYEKAKVVEILVIVCVEYAHGGVCNVKEDCLTRLSHRVRIGDIVHVNNQLAKVLAIHNPAFRIVSLEDPLNGIIVTRKNIRLAETVVISKQNKCVIL